MTLATSIMHIPADQFIQLYGVWALGALLVVATFVALTIRERHRG